LPDLVKADCPKLRRFAMSLSEAGYAKRSFRLRLISCAAGKLKQLTLHGEFVKEKAP
jgi:hypothetical protein